LHCVTRDLPCLGRRRAYLNSRCLPKLRENLSTTCALRLAKGEESILRIGRSYISGLRTTRCNRMNGRPKRAFERTATMTSLLLRGTGGRWSDRAKAAYKSWRDYIIAVKGKMRHRVTLSTQSESAAFRRISLISSSGDLWCGVVHDGVSSPQFFL